jgi:hypothetical protein
MHPYEVDENNIVPFLLLGMRETQIVKNAHPK